MRVAPVKRTERAALARGGKAARLFLSCFVKALVEEKQENKKEEEGEEWEEQEEVVVGGGSG